MQRPYYECLHSRKQSLLIDLAKYTAKQTQSLIKLTEADRNSKTGVVSDYS